MTGQHVCDVSLKINASDLFLPALDEPLNQPLRNDLQTINKTAVLVAVCLNDNKRSRENVLDELKGLVKTAGVKVVGELVQFRQMVHPGTCLGPGKIEELKLILEETRAELVIFDNNLTPGQGRRLEQETGRVIVDRSELILDIFATHARTAEARLQVELAQLQYNRTRLKRLWTHLERIDGGIGASRGPGEKQIETDRRLIDQRISELQLSLKEVEQRRERMVKQRRDHALVSLVGYTNAGKSTLMRALTGEEVYIADQLFATLDTKTRLWKIPGWGDALLSDTVGFVRDLPHSLVASFKSTLEEARHADLLLHVVDASNPEAEAQVATVEAVLEEIGVELKNFILVLNKADQVPDRMALDLLRARYEWSVSISARTGDGLDRLAQLVVDRLGDGLESVTVSTGIEDGKLLGWLSEHATIIDTHYSETTATFRCRISRSMLPRLRQRGTVLEDHHDQSSLEAVG